jgi:hypothetical protein
LKPYSDDSRTDERGSLRSLCERGNVARTRFASIIFVILVPTIAHVLFSSLGFEPSDDGFTLAYGRRIIEGQIPHRDFIMVRPFLSPVLHIPVVLWGGDYTYLLSRLVVWFQFACIAWIWVFLIGKGLGKQTLGNLEKISIALISFALSAHTFPIMAWHTVDGLFLMSIGLALCASDVPKKKLAGYFLVGLAYLCKQSFLFVAPFSLLLIGDWREWKYWLSSAMPGLLYVAYLTLTNSLDDAILQLTSHGKLLTVGLTTYFNREVLLGVLVGHWSTRLVIAGSRTNLRLSDSSKEWLGLIMLSVIPLMVISASFILGRFVLTSSFGVFGLVAGVVVCVLSERIKIQSKPPGIIGLVLMMAWSAAISVGYNYPALASGPLMAVLILFTRPFILKKLGTNQKQHIYPATLAILSVTVVLSFGLARMNHTYIDRSISNVSKSLNGILAGGRGIVANEYSFDFLVDLQSAIKVSRDLGTSYTIIPDCPGWWVKERQLNRISLDWAQRKELNQPELLQRIIDELESMRDSNTVIVQKFRPGIPSRQYTPIGDQVPLVEHIRRHFSKEHETSLFELYR